MEAKRKYYFNKGIEAKALNGDEKWRSPEFGNLGVIGDFSTGRSGAMLSAEVKFRVGRRWVWERGKRVGMFI